MVPLDEWLKNYLSGKESYLKSAKQDEAVRIIDTLLGRINESDEWTEGFKYTCSLIDQFISQARPVLNKEKALILDPLCSKFLDLVITVAATEKELHAYLRDETSILSKLTSSLNDNYDKEDHTKILQTVEVLSRGLTVTWSAPYLRQLIHRALSVLLYAATDTAEFLYALRIITNIVFNNTNCISQLARDPNYRNVMRRLYDLLSQPDCRREVTAMNLNFGYLSDPSINVGLQTQMKNVKAAFIELQTQVESSGSVENLRSVAASVYYLTLCVSTLLDRIEKEHNELLQKPEAIVKVEGAPTKSGPVLVKSVTEDVMGIVFTKIFPKCVPMMRFVKGRVVIEAMMGLLKALCPNYMNPQIFNNHWDHFVKALNDLSYVASGKSKAQISVIDTHLHFVDRIIKANPKNFQVGSFSFALHKCSVVSSVLPVDLIRNILTIRLFNRLNALAQQFKDSSDAIAGKIAQVLNEKTLSELLEYLLSQTNIDSPVPCILLSTCVVEILNAISKVAKTHTTLIENLQKENTWLHISNCIKNGDEELITQAFTLMTAVGFSSNCRAGVSKMLLSMREVPSAPTTPVKSQEMSLYPSGSSMRGMKRLYHNLEMFEMNHKEDESKMIDDVLAWYKLKNDMHEMELSNMTEHIFHLNRTVAHLKLLLNKQSELVAKGTISTKTMEKDFLALQKQLDATKEKKVELEAKHAKAMEALRQELLFQEQLYKQKTDKLVKVEKEYEEMKERCKKLEANNQAASQASSQLEKENRKLQEKLEKTEKEYGLSKQQVASLESELKKSEEARKTSESLLEAERRKTEIIQQILGNRMS